MELSDYSFYDLKFKFLILYEEYNRTIKNFRFTCEHFMHATSLFLEISSIFLQPKNNIAGLPLLHLIEQLLRSLALIEEIQVHTYCLLSNYNN